MAVLPRRARPGPLPPHDSRVVVAGARRAVARRVDSDEQALQAGVLSRKARWRRSSLLMSILAENFWRVVK